jgi:hypothetical protein
VFGEVPVNTRSQENIVRCSGDIGCAIRVTRDLVKTPSRLSWHLVESSQLCIPGPDRVLTPLDRHARRSVRTTTLVAAKNRSFRRRVTE